MRIVIFSIIGLFLFTQCKKQKPKAGEYEVVYKYHEKYNKPDVTFKTQIHESTKDWLVFGVAYPAVGFFAQDTLYKNKNSVNGSVFGERWIGTISRDGFSTRFKITGSFITHETGQTIGAKEYIGTFEMKKK